MADSTLDPDNMPIPDRQLGKGHGIGSLGPSNTSDNGSDMAQNAGGLNEHGNFTDEDENDTDAEGTGEREVVSGDANVEIGSDISADRVFRVDTDQTDEEVEP